MALYTPISAVRILPRQQVLPIRGTSATAPPILKAHAMVGPSRITLVAVASQVHTLLNFDSKPRLLRSPDLRAKAIEDLCASITDLNRWEGELIAQDIPTNVEDLIARMPDKDAPVVLVRVREITRCTRRVCDTSDSLTAVPVKDLIRLRIQLAREGRTEESNEIRDIVHDTWRAIRKARELQAGIIPQRLGQLEQAIATVRQDPRLTPKEKEELNQASIELPILGQRAQTNVHNLDIALQELEVEMAAAERAIAKIENRQSSPRTVPSQEIKSTMSELYEAMNQPVSAFRHILIHRNPNIITEAFKQMYAEQAEEHVVYLRQHAKKEFFEKLEKMREEFKAFTIAVEQRMTEMSSWFGFLESKRAA